MHLWSAFYAFIQVSNLIIAFAPFLLNTKIACVMNIITHDAAYSLYPLPTFIDHIALSFATTSPLDVIAVKKYEERGWAMLPSYDLSVWTSVFAVGKTRSVLDTMTWKVPFETTGVDESRQIPCPITPTLRGTWTLTPQGCKLKQEFFVLRPSVFRYGYVLARDPFVRYILDFVRHEEDIREDETEGMTVDEKRRFWTWYVKMCYPSPFAH
jgi:hypothetical protein